MAFALQQLCTLRLQTPRMDHAFWDVMRAVLSVHVHADMLLLTTLSC